MDAAAYADVVKQVALLAICTLSFSIRLFSVVKYESVIHGASPRRRSSTFNCCRALCLASMLTAALFPAAEFDPYFNYRVTQFLTKEGFYDTWNWFDTRTWYPLGRVVGGTMYPVCNSLHIHHVSFTKRHNSAYIQRN